MIKKINKLFVYLSLMMGIVVISSNFLVQFPIKYFGLEEILTYGALSYPITFLITDLSNRAFGKFLARRIVYLGFTTGIFLTLIASTNIFDKLRKNKKWYIAPLFSSLLGSFIDTFLFFVISFYKTGVPWVTLAIGDFLIKILIALLMLIPFRLFLKRIKDLSGGNFLYKT